MTPPLRPGLAPPWLRPLLAAVRAAAREGDLAGVVAQGAGALGEQDVRPVRALAEQHEHRGPPPAVRRRDAVAAEGLRVDAR